MRYLKENTYTITSLTFRILTCSVFEILYDTKSIRYCLMSLYSFDAYNCTDTTVIVYELWVIKSRLLFLIFHSPIILSCIICYQIPDIFQSASEFPAGYFAVDFFSAHNILLFFIVVNVFSF